ncbi:hypothetical protein F0251_22140 [Vibrio sp. 070316B]|uniref:hypothetical protein n=1 Tax=Vibrio sp. 070316B TaxID=2607608 RepID=UPI00149394A3|nr:hypothetical protein [Vibrio sp. 070316B]NOI41112.1 hypothetical protein [Vibrio sp. 070316B]
MTKKIPIDAKYQAVVIEDDLTFTPQQFQGHSIQKSVRKEIVLEVVIDDKDEIESLKDLSDITKH